MKKWNYYLKRICSNKLKLAVIALLFILPVYDMYCILRDIQIGGSVYDPNLLTFLPSTLFNGAQMVLMWYLPLYFLLIVADDCIEDVKFGYKNLLITRWSKGGYFRINIAKGFVISFAVLFLSLALNLLLTQIAFAGGTYLSYEDSTIQSIPSLKAAFQHPFLTNCLYIVIMSFFAGIVGMGAVAIAMAIPNRFLVYPLVFLMWYIPSVLPKSIIYAIQPFTEYGLQDVWGTILLVIVLNAAAVAASYIKVMKYDQV